MEDLLLAFSCDAPCWDDETLALAEYDGGGMDFLISQGFVEPGGGGYVLTHSGYERKCELASELCIPRETFIDSVDDDAIWNHRLRLLVSGAFVGRFGLKEFSCGEALPFSPHIADDELFITNDGRVRYVWEKHPLVQNFYESFPHWGVGYRGKTAPGHDGLMEWSEKNGAPWESVRFNVVLRNRYDFALYRRHKALQADKFCFQNADRVLFLRATPDGALDIYRTLGYLHIFMLGQRRVYIPGYADIDSEEQENMTVLALVCDTEAELAELCSALAPQAPELIEPAHPLFVVGTSVERLKSGGKRETMYDWFCDDCCHIARPDA